MKFLFKINCENEKEFLDHWETIYSDSESENIKETKYTMNIDKPLTTESLQLLYEWKNGGNISNRKKQSIIKNYPLVFIGDEKERYLNPDKPGGPIWNIFYIHILNPNKWPIFDQHVYRAMMYIRKQVIEEIPTSKKSIINAYLNIYIPFIEEFDEPSYKRIDKALYSYGQFLKKAKKFVKY